MAGDWIKIETTTPDKPEVFQLAEILGLEPDAVLGKLVRVWVWANQQTYDGNAGTVTETLLGRIAGNGDFAAALIKVGWLASSGGLLTFPHFERHNGQSAKARALTAKRVAIHKTKKGNAQSVSREEKRREEKSKGETPLPPSGPPKVPFDPGKIRLPFDTEAFREAWAEWIEHRRQIRKKLTPLAVTKQIKRLESMGEARAVATIQHTIEKQWIGLQEPDREPGQKPAFTSRGRDLGGDQ